MCMYAKLIEHNLVGQPEIRKANFGGDHTPYQTSCRSVYALEFTAEQKICGK